MQSKQVGYNTPEVNEATKLEVRRSILLRAGAAKANPRAFFSFVVREETTQARVECLPFQQVVYKFVEHFDRCVIRMPVGFSKTFTMAALSMFLLGKDPTTRGAIISASQGQAQKPVAMVRDYIDNSQELRLVFPKLRPSLREGDPWTQNKITVDRPYGIRDPSLTAVGYKGKLPGARLNWILVDDILTEENTSTPEQRQGVAKWFNSTVLSRRDIKGTKIVVTNTPWHPEDITYRLEKAGWPTLAIDIEGNIQFTNTCESDLVDGADIPLEGEFDCEEVRPSHVSFPRDKANDELIVPNDTKELHYRLTAHDRPEFDPDGEATETYFDRYDVVPLWPEKYTRAAIESLKVDYRASMHEYYQLYMCVCRDDESARVKVEWIDACKAEARARDIYTYTSKWDQGGTYTGVDLAIGKKRSNNKTSIFTFAVLPDKMRRVLRIDAGRWSGKEIISIISEHHDNYGSIVRVENNAAQDFLRQWAREANRSLPIRGVPTGRNKSSKAHGVESIFVEIENAAWLIPNDHLGGVEKAVQDWIDSMLYYNPDQHTGDELMSCWLAREQARASGALRHGASDRPKRDQIQRQLAAGLRSR